MQESSHSNNGSTDTPRALRLHADDNVAVALGGIGPGAIEVLGGGDDSIHAREAISQGHKIALRFIAEREAVMKYGVAIGYATAPIAVGTWVHTHNCRSGLDERSHTLDPHSGVPTDTHYV